MTHRLVHMPYHTSAKPFSIGLRSITPETWLEPDADLGRYLDEKARLIATERPQVFLAEPGTEAAQQECLDTVAGHLLRDHAHLCYRTAEGRLALAGREVALDAPGTPPLEIAGSLVQDDLVLLRRRETGWHIVAAYVAFPSAWSLPEKFGRPMEEVHAPVPGFQAGTRNAGLINRIFDNLQPELPAERFNWSVYPRGDLFWPPEVSAAHGRAPFDAASHIVRVERQTLRRLPVSGDIVFTIRIYIDPIAALLRHADGAALAQSLADRLDGLEPDQLAYKAMTAKKDGLVAYLRQAAQEKSDA